MQGAATGPDRAYQSLRHKVLTDPALAMNGTALMTSIRIR